MSKKLLLIIGLIVLIVGGGLGFWFYRSRSVQTPVAPQEASGSSAGSGSAVDGNSIANLQASVSVTSDGSANVSGRATSTKTIPSSAIPKYALLQSDSPQLPVVMYQGRALSQSEFEKAWNTSTTKKVVDPGANTVVPIDPVSDKDKDGLSYDQEMKLGTDPNNADTDGDGLTDGMEVMTLKANPKNFDTDGDGLMDGEEVNVYKTDPAKLDTDGDGYSDGVEVKGGYNPLGSGKLKK